MKFKDVRIGLIKILIDLNEKLFFERLMRDFYKKSEKINIVIDVGANKGQSIDFFLTINPECKIYAIEPNPELFSLLVKKYSGNANIKIFNFGISDKVGDKLFFENVLDYTSSFEELNMNSEYLKKKAKILGVDKDAIITKSYSVNVTTLSEFIKMCGFNENIDVLKIDTEGHEYYCLEGLFLDKSEAKIKYIQLENHNDDMYFNRIKFSQINELLNKNYFFECKKIKHGYGDFDEVIFSCKTSPKNFLKKD
ncbi:MAG: FkbM family methyltransferase [Bacteroidetes bacterium]|nr:FkbM family methyltransferase [Bacteroidota bacterium]HET6244979.1 FkbM family methyltransferase [Bacteroidia bacterium]